MDKKKVILIFLSIVIIVVYMNFFKQLRKHKINEKELTIQTIKPVEEVEETKRDRLKFTGNYPDPFLDKDKKIIAPITKKSENNLDNNEKPPFILKGIMGSTAIISNDGSTDFYTLNEIVSGWKIISMKEDEIVVKKSKSIHTMFIQ